MEKAKSFLSNNKQLTSFTAGFVGALVALPIVFALATDRPAGVQDVAAAQNSDSCVQEAKKTTANKSSGAQSTTSTSNTSVKKIVKENNLVKTKVVTQVRDVVNVNDAVDINNNDILNNNLNNNDVLSDNNVSVLDNNLNNNDTNILNKFLIGAGLDSLL